MSLQEHRLRRTPSEQAARLSGRHPCRRFADVPSPQERTQILTFASHASGAPRHIMCNNGKERETGIMDGCAR